VPQFRDPVLKSASELIPALEESIATARQLLGPLDDGALTSTWRLMNGERELFAIPRVALIRSVMSSVPQRASAGGERGTATRFR